MVEANSRKANVDPRLRAEHLREHDKGIKAELEQSAYKQPRLSGTGSSMVQW
jgi:hypothetical protein